MKLVKQHDERDCGAACLSMIASHYGLKHPISKYRELTKTDQNGANLYGLCDAAKKIGFKAEALLGDTEELLDGIQNAEIKFPFIAHIINEDYMQHFVVVLSIKNNKFIIADPAKGKVKYTIEQFSQLWNGYIVTFEKTESFKKGNYEKGGFRKFFSLLKGQYIKLTSIILLSLIISIIGIVGAFVFEIIIDDFYTVNETIVCEDNCEEEHEHTTQEDIGESQSFLDKAVNFITNNASNFNLFFICLIGLYILQASIQFLRGYLISIVSKKIDMRLLLPYYDHIIDLPMSVVNTRSTGEYLSRFSDASAVRDAISGATLTLLLDSVMVIGCGVILFMENAILFYISLIVILLYAVVVLCYRKPLENINREVMENNARVQSYLKESIDGIETVKSHQAEASAKSKNSCKFQKLISSVFKDNIISISQDSICDLIELVGIVIILWVGFGMVLANAVTIGSLITFYALLEYFTEPIKNLISLQPTIQSAFIAAERLNDILDIPTEYSIENFQTDLSWNKIEFLNVDFRYGNHELVLKNISLNIEKGQKVAIVGESGCGKTTLVKLLLRFYKAEKGKILIDGKNLPDIPLKNIRKDISYIDQNTFLFSDTVKNNLMLGNPSATDEEIAEACKQANADSFICELPFRYDTYLDENGKNLSGGQRQRLAIARALLRKPNLIIFDEATSNLDTITECAVKDTIFNLSKDMTCIIIAHRLSTIKNCDKIVVMDKGQIVEIGTHQELMGKKGKYFELYNRQ
ncbi:MAG: peptidase domain-containing ABC transporter [Oscillospiraceae bacterium]|nr:peptidase domain-containing ABC transporter [Oscillospiraceae bacterium]